MALLSRGINWRKLFDAGDQVRIASALAQLSADLEDLDARMEGGTNDLNQAQQFPAQDLLERGTQFLTPDMVTSTDGSVTVTPDSFRGTVDLAVSTGSAGQYSGGAASNSYGGGNQTVVFSEELDTTNSYDGTTLTCPFSGNLFVNFNGTIVCSDASPTNTTLTLRVILFVNGSAYGGVLVDAALQHFNLSETGTATFAVPAALSKILPVSAGDAVTIVMVDINGTGNTYSISSGQFNAFYLST